MASNQWRKGYFPVGWKPGCALSVYTPAQNGGSYGQIYPSAIEFNLTAPSAPGGVAYLSFTAEEMPDVKLWLDWWRSVS